MPHIAFLYAMQVGDELASLEIYTDYYWFIMEGIQVIVVRPINGISFLQQRPQAGSTLVCRVPRDFLSITRKWRKANTGNESCNKNNHHLAALRSFFRTSRRVRILAVYCTKKSYLPSPRVLELHLTVEACKAPKQRDNVQNLRETRCFW